MKRVAIYIRVSTDNQKEGDSLRDQQETCQEFLTQHDDYILVDTYIDNGFSGQKLERDEFKRLMADVQEKRIDLILFTKLDRWFRSVRHYLNSQAILDKNNVSWLAVTQMYLDPSTPYGRAIITQIMTFAELEAQADSERVKAVFANKVKNGEVITGKVPWGYCIEDKRFAVVEEEAEKVRAVFEYFLKSASLRATQAFMYENFGRYRETGGIKNMLKTEKYIGKYRDNYNYCPPIIDRDLFYSVQGMLKAGARCTRKHDYIFTGMLICAVCGRRMAGIVSHCRYKEKRTKRLAYICHYHRGRAKTCSNPRTISETKLESLLLERVRPELSKYVVNFEVSNAPILRNDSKKENLKRRLSRLKDAYLAEVISLEEYRKDKEAIESELKALEQMPVERAKDLTAIKKFLSYDYETIYKTLQPVEKRTLWLSIIKEIKISRETFEIVFI